MIRTLVSSGEVPSLDGLSLKHAVDAYTIGKALDQWRDQQSCSEEGQAIAPRKEVDAIHYCSLESEQGSH